MSKVAIQGNASGTGTFTIAAPNSNSNQTLTLPDESGTVLTSASAVAASQITSALNATGSAPIYACRAWVNFNGTGAVAIRASGNVSSITDNGTGDYTVNFTNAMSDVNYAVNVSGNVDATGNYGYSFAVPYSTSPTTSAIRLAVSNPSVRVDAGFVEVSIFR